jgi:hypothetical protein
MRGSEPRIHVLQRDDLLWRTADGGITAMTAVKTH